MKVHGKNSAVEKLAQWLVVKEYIRKAKEAVEEAGRAAKELPASQDVFDLLAAYIDTGWATVQVA